MSRIAGLVTGIILSIMVTGCHNSSLHSEGETRSGMTREELRNRLYPPQKEKPTVTFETSAPPSATPPDLIPILASPELPPIRNDRLITLTVTDNVPLKDVLLEIGRLADIDIEIDPAISGGVIFRAKDQPLHQVVQRLCNLANLHYENKDGVLRIMRDTPYVEHYQVDFLNLSRKNNSTLETRMQMGSGGGAGSAGVTSGSGNAMTATNESDLWTTVEGNIKQLLTSHLPTLSEGDRGNVPYVVLNKTAGIISVFATHKQQRFIHQYLDNVKATSSAQVLIEAKIVEVTLSDGFHAGVNWGLLNKMTTRPGSFLSVNGANSAANALRLGIIKSKPPVTVPGGQPVYNDNGNLDALLSFTETFGSTTTLASPRLHAMNNQQAILSFTKNKIYFTLKIEKEDKTTAAASSDTTSTTVTSTLNTIPIGIVLNIQPSINIETNEIILSVRPTLTRWNGEEVTDPGVEYIRAITELPANVSLESKIPVIQVRELDSIVKIHSGDVMVIGGMIDQRTTDADEGVPGMNRIPVAGALFKKTDNSMEIVETVVFIKATIVNSSHLDPVDINFYNDFNRDTHPFEFKQ